MRRGRVFGWLALAVSLAVAVPGCGGKKGGAVRLQGAGSSFVDPMMQEWAAAYKDKGEVNYQSKGSGAGIIAATAASRATIPQVDIIAKARRRRGRRAGEDPE